MKEEMIDKLIYIYTYVGDEGEEWSGEVGRLKVETEGKGERRKVER